MQLPWRRRGNETVCICGRFLLLFWPVMIRLTWWGFEWDTITRAVVSPKVIFSKCLINPDVAAMYHTQNSRKQSLKTPPPSLHRPLEATFSGFPPGLAEPQHHQGVPTDSIVQQPISLPLAGLAVLSVSWGFVLFFFLSCDLNQEAVKLLCSVSVCFPPRCIYKCLPHG